MTIAWNCELQSLWTGSGIEEHKVINNWKLVAIQIVSSNKITAHLKVLFFKVKIFKRMGSEFAPLAFIQNWKSAMIKRKQYNIFIVHR